MKSQKYKNTALKKVVLTAALVLLAVIQNSFLPALGSTTAFFPLIPFAAAAAMFEHEFTGMLLGLLAGLLWDVSSPLPDGILALLFTILFCAAGLLSHYVLRRTLLSACVITAVVTAVYLTVCFIFGMFSRGAGLTFSYITVFCLPALIITVLFTPVFYSIIKFTEKKFSE